MIHSIQTQTANIIECQSPPHQIYIPKSPFRVPVYSPVTKQFSTITTTKIMCTITHTHHDCSHIHKYTYNCSLLLINKSHRTTSSCPQARKSRLWSLNKCARCTRAATAEGKKAIKIKETKQSKIYREPRGGWKVVDWSGGRNTGRHLESMDCTPSPTTGSFWLSGALRCLV